MNRTVLSIMLCWAAAIAAAQAQVPVEEAARQNEVELQRGQYRAGHAYRELQQRRHEARLAEQDAVNTEDAYRRAQQQADALKQQLDAARKALASARAKESAARERYEREVEAVNRLQQQAQPRAN